MKKRSLGALLLTASIVMGTLAGCSGGAEETTAAATTAAATEAAAEETEAAADTEAADASGEEGASAELTKDEITLTVWHIAIDEKRHQTVTNAMNRFMEKYPNIKVVDVVNENDPYKTKLSTAMAAGEEPDIFVSWGGGWLENFINEGKVLDIDEWVKEVEDEYYPSALSLFQVNGKNYSLPYSCGPTPVYYNKQIYADLGLEVPTTTEEFADVITKVANGDPDDFMKPGAEDDAPGETIEREADVVVIGSGAAGLAAPSGCGVRDVGVARLHQLLARHNARF